MSFLTPLFLLGAAGIAIPVLVHLIQRERKNVVAFPSLMFVQRIPYQSVRRRRIRHWYLLAMRIAALLLIVAAFARPFLPQRAAAAVAAVGGNRELVVLLDRSASMGYGDRFSRAQKAARDAVSSIGMNDKATLVLFDRDTEETVRATSDRGRLESAINAATVSASGTRFGPALKFAEGVLSRSTLQRREAVLISDFQKTGWSGGEDLHFSKNMTLTPVTVGDDNTTNISVPSVTFQRSEFSGKELIRVTAGVANKGVATNSVKVALDIDGHELESQNVSVGSNASTSVQFQPFPLIEGTARGVVRAGSDSMPADNTFNFIVTPSQSISVLVIDSGGRTEDAEGSSYHLLKALGIGNNPTFKVEALPAGRVSPEQLERPSVVILNDAVVPPGLAGGELKRFVERGGGLLVAFGEHSGGSNTESDLLPGTLGQTVDRLDSRGGTVGTRDYSHKIFEIFKAQRSGDFSLVRIFRYRSLTPGPDDRVLASYDDGAVAAAERRIGNGRVIVLTTSLDTSWTDWPKSSVYLPLVQQVVKYLARYEPPSSWSTVGQAVDLAARFRGKADRIVVTPSNERRTLRSNESSVLELTEQGVYEVRAAASGGGRPDRIAVNIDPVESDLGPMDPQELVAAVTGLANPNASRVADEDSTLTPADAERRQSLWWYLLILGLGLLAAEMLIANRLSEHERFT